VDHALENYADDLREIIEYFNYPSYKLAGLSMGGASSWMYLRKYNMDRIKEYLNIDQGIRFFNSEDWKYGFAGDQQKNLFDKAYLLIGESIKYPRTPFSKLPKAVKNLFDEQFAIGQGRKWILTQEESKEVKSFLTSAIIRTAEETVKAVEVEERILKSINSMEKWTVSDMGANSGDYIVIRKSSLYDLSDFTKQKTKAKEWLKGETKV